MACKFCKKKSDFEVCNECTKKQHPKRAKQIWNQTKELANDLGQAYYDHLLDKYDKKIIVKDSKENFGFNTFCDGINLGLDIIMPLLDDSGINAAKQKIKGMLEIRRRKTNRKAKDEKTL